MVIQTQLFFISNFVAEDCLNKKDILVEKLKATNILLLSNFYLTFFYNHQVIYLIIVRVVNQ